VGPVIPRIMHQNHVASVSLSSIIPEFGSTRMQKVGFPERDATITTCLELSYDI